MAQTWEHTVEKEDLALKKRLILDIIESYHACFVSCKVVLCFYIKNHKDKSSHFFLRTEWKNVRNFRRIFFSRNDFLISLEFFQNSSMMDFLQTPGISSKLSNPKNSCLLEYLRIYMNSTSPLEIHPKPSNPYNII